jgi:hypothetical protein
MPRFLMPNKWRLADITIGLSFDWMSKRVRDMHLHMCTKVLNGLSISDV